MTLTYLIGRQEFIKYVTRRGFLISVLMFPLWIMIVAFVPRWTGGSADSPLPHTIAVVDRTGGAYADAVRDALATRGTSVWHYAPVPGSVAGMPDSGIAKAVRRVFAEGYASGMTANGPPLDILVVVPKGFDAGRIATVWSEHGIGTPLHDLIANALSRQLRLAAIHRYAPALRDPSLLDADVSLDARDPSHAGRGTAFDSLVPIALAIILFVVSVMNSSVLLQGVVEEKSTRMIEVLLSCATPRQITAGKLIGVIAVAMTTLIIWGAVLFLLMAVASKATVALVLAAVGSIAAPSTLMFLLVFFLTGLLIYGAIFLAIGSMAASLADAQTLLGPSMLILMLPNLMIAGVMHDPNGPFATTLSFVPIYTPFFMMLRIASHPPEWQLWAGAALAIATTGLMLLWTGRIFARHVLTTERPPSLGALVGGLFRRG